MVQEQEQCDFLQDKVRQGLDGHKVVKVKYLKPKDAY